MANKVKINNGLVIFVSIIIFSLLLGTVVPQNPLYKINWALLSSIIILLPLLLIFWRFEKNRVDTRMLVLIATMSSLAAVVRVFFSAVMSLQPATFIIMITGYVFGAQAGFMVGAVTALISNFFLGQGPWTPWQMFCWGFCGILASLLASRREGFQLVSFAALAGFCGYLYGWIINIWHWTAFVYPLNLKTFLAVYSASVVFDTMHAVGNVVFSILFGALFYRILIYFKKYIKT